MSFATANLELEDLYMASVICSVKDHSYLAIVCPIFPLSQPQQAGEPVFVAPPIFQYFRRVTADERVCFLPWSVALQGVGYDRGSYSENQRDFQYSAKNT